MQNEPAKQSGWLVVFNYPRVKSALSSLLLVAVTAIGSVAVSKGWVSPENAVVIETSMVTLILGVIGGLIAWKAQQVSPTNLIAAVNQGENGVKVVDALAPAATVDAPIKPVSPAK